MLTNPKTLMFMLTLISGTLISVSATSWYGAWMGLEINLLSFVPLISSTNNQRMTESALKYFLIQALASMVLLMAVIMMSFNQNIIEQMTNAMMTTALTLKLGAAPMHFWMPEVMEGMNWGNCIILMTWQKLAPLTLLSYNTSPVTLIVMITISSVFIGAIGGLNQTSLRKIMAFSSINHAGWLIGAMLCNNTSWFLYFTLYTILTLMATSIFMTSKTFHINQTFNAKMDPLTKLAIFTGLLSLGGLPPFLGFLPKWIVIMTMTQSLYIFTIIVMVMTALITLYYYMRIAYSAFILTHSTANWTPNKISWEEKTTSMSVIILSLTGLMMTPLIMGLTM
uniref:NADH-ubiquinone oxidoreductase chain 2 n=1 Tax=Ctenolepisma villosum TaxID=257043 RepID=A0A6C0U7W0_9INSE|nr:NADH dehydrogenase subunit 2 [Ctenolepisma villosum]QIB71360.1 NADH dehydrogenase subunit 2 [Ctenolepisma villosum]